MMRIATISVLSMITIGCAGSCPAVSGGGRIDPMLVKSGATLEGAEKYELRADAAGNVEKISLYHKSAKSVPEAVMKLVEATLPGAKVKKYELERYGDGKLSHEVEVTTADGKDCEVSSTETGELRYLECDVKVAEVPEAVSKAALAKLPGGQITEAETLKGPGIDEFSLDVKVGEVMHELRLKPTGEILSHRLAFPATIEVPAE